MVQRFEFVLEALPVTVSSIPLIGTLLPRSLELNRKLGKTIHLYIDLKYPGIPHSEKNENTRICVWY